MNKFYDGSRLLSMKDLNGETPEIYICTSNRNAGKTTYFSRYLVNRFIKYREKFCVIYRFNYEMKNTHDKFFKDIQNLFFPGWEMSSRSLCNGAFYELFLTGIDDKTMSCGYAIAINQSDQIKKFSHMLSDVTRCMFDEFQSETNHYANDEITKFISIHTSIARGGGSQVRYLPVYMVGNPVSIINPYYVALGISDRLRDNTKFLRGNGYVLEQGFNETASKLQKSSAFNTAFSNAQYTAYSSQAIYLNDNKAFIDKPRGQSRYLVTLKYMGSEYAIREYGNLGVIYCDDKPDPSCKQKLAITTDDHNINYVLLQANSFFVGNMRSLFEKGCFRFKNLKCKEAILKLVAY